jgi:hypothetical protein
MHYKDARSNNASELVRELSGDPGMGFGLGKNPQQLETETLSALRGAASTLKEKAPDDMARPVLTSSRSIKQSSMRSNQTTAPRRRKGTRQRIVNQMSHAADIRAQLKAQVAGGLIVSARCR